MNARKIQTLLAYERYLYETEFTVAGRLLRKTLKNSVPLWKRSYASPTPTPCDILLIGYGDKMQAVLSILEKKGLRIQRESLAAKRILANNMLAEPQKSLPRSLVYYDAVAKFLVRQYQPKVVCCSLDYSPLAPFLRHELHTIGGTCINIAHAVTPAKYTCSMFDFDYYFLFGQSSLRNIYANPVRIGGTNAVLTGSPFVRPKEVLPPPNPENHNVLFFSQVKHVTSHRFFYAPTHMKYLIESAEIVIQWAKAHPEFHLFVKQHPGGDEPFIHRLCRGIPNVTVLEKSVPMVEALREVALVINTASNASLEAAILNRPTVVINKSGLWQNYLAFEDFFLPAATNAKELHHNILQTFDQYDALLSRTQAFVKFHLEHITDSVKFIADCVEAIYQDEENFTSEPILEELSGLHSYMSENK